MNRIQARKKFLYNYLGEKIFQDGLYRAAKRTEKIKNI